MLRFLNIRRLQWRFAFIGQYLQIYPRSLLDRLSRHYPRQWIQVSQDHHRLRAQDQRLCWRACCCSCSRNRQRLLELRRKDWSSWLMDCPVSKETRYSGCERNWKPDVLKGTHEEVQKVWKTWSYKFETWFSSQWGTGQTALDYARKKGDDPITPHDSFEFQYCRYWCNWFTTCMWHWYHLPMEQHMTLYSTLERSVGWDAWRRLCGTYEPQNNRTNIRLLRTQKDKIIGFSIPQGPLWVLWEVVLIGLKLMLPSMKQGDNPNHQMRFFVLYYFN